MLGFYLAAEHIDGVAHGLEGVKADAERQHAHAGNFGNSKPCQSIDGANDKVGILKKDQHGKAAHDRNDQKQTQKAFVISAFFHAKAAHIVQQDQNQHNGEKLYFAPRVKDQAANK